MTAVLTSVTRRSRKPWSCVTPACASREAVEVLVGHSLGLAGVYTDPEALGLREAVGMVPAIGAGNVEPLRRRGGE